MDQKYIVALELSGTQVKGAVASIGMHPNGTSALPTIEAIVAENSTDCVQYGRVQNLISAAQLTNIVVNRLLSEPVLDGGVIKGVYLGLAGRSLGSERTSAEITLPTEMVITNDILKNLYIEASNMVSQNKRVLKVLPRKYVVDNQAMPNPVGALGRKLRGDFTLVTCNPNNQRNLDLVFADSERVNLPVKGYIVTPLAVADMTLDEEDKQLGCILVDLGYQTTTISIYKDRALQYLATLPMGSQNITRDIAVGMNVTMEKAEAAKCNNGDATATSRGTDELSRINAYIASRAYEIAANIAANIEYAGYKPSDLPAGYILTGRGSRLRNFDKLLANQGKLKVRYASMPTSINHALKTNNIDADDFTSLIAIIMRASRNPDSESCVTFRPVVEEKPVQISEPAYEAPEQSEVSTERETVKKTVDEKYWDKDDDEINENPKEEKKKKKDRWNLINKLKVGVERLVSADNMEDDTEI